jgi:hypothetical protein
MFPSGRLRYDVPPSRWPAAGEAVTGYAHPIRRAKWDAPDQPIGARTLTDLFHALERIAGVTPSRGAAGMASDARLPTCTRITSRASGC